MEFRSWKRLKDVFFCVSKLVGGDQTIMWRPLFFPKSLAK
jgi:hypothetical protein